MLYCLQHWVCRLPHNAVWGLCRLIQDEATQPGLKPNPPTAVHACMAQSSLSQLDTELMACHKVGLTDVTKV